MIASLRASTAYHRAALAAVAIGIALRAAFCLRRGGPAGDELMLALNVATRGFAGLTHPLDYAQIAPVPFLWAQRLMVDLVGVRDIALRVVPLLAGCAMLVALRGLAAALLTPMETAAALALAATSPFLIQYSAEGKPYAVDALVTVLVAASAVALLRRPADVHAWRRMALVGAAAPLVSVTAPMVLAPVALALASVAWRDGSRARLRLAGVLALWGATFAEAWLGTYRAAAAMPYMRQYWSAAMLSPGPRWGVRWIAGIREALWPVSYWTVQVGAAWLVLLACAAGALILLRRLGPRLALVLAGPPVALLLASAAGRYPIAMRLTLFVTPLLVMLAAVGVAAAAAGLARLLPSVRPGVAVAAVLAPSFLAAFGWVARAPEDHQGIPALVSRLEQRWAPGEPVYLFHRVAAEWAWYTTDWRRPDLARLAWVARVAGPGGPGFVNAPPHGPRHPGDGDDLIYRYDGRDELYGLASGVQGRAWLAVDPRDLPDWPVTADSGWALVEASRLGRAVPGRAWAVFGTDSPGTEIVELLAAVRRSGGVVESRLERQGATLYAIRFDAPARPAAAP